MKTKIILQKDIPNLGVAGDQKEVAVGYARNYLFPYKMAIPATFTALKLLETRREKVEEERKTKLAVAQAEAKKLEGVVCPLSFQAGDDGKLFGSVTTADVASALIRQGFPVDRRWVDLRTPIRTTGEFEGLVRLHPQVRVSFKIVVNAIL
jgi:large subunit ribosomal protein L9